jgi:hypothetical protein
MTPNCVISVSDEVDQFQPGRYSIFVLLQTETLLRKWPHKCVTPTGARPTSNG